MLPSVAQADPSLADDSENPKADYNLPQSPARPAPKGLAFIDQGQSDKRLKGYRTPEGFKVEIVAEKPTVINPVGLTFADDGTPWVLEWRPSPGDERLETIETVKYKDGSTRKFAVQDKKKKDVVKVLTASKKDGVFDKAKVVLDEEYSSSILLHDGWLYLCGRGTVRRYKQSKPDGPYDKKETIAQGFACFGDGQVSGMTLGVDGWLYLTAGAGDHYVEGSDGSRATVLRTGAIFRCRPDGSKLHTFAIGFCNPRGDVSFDLGGNLFHSDADPGGKGKFAGCRLMHVNDSADFGFRLAPGSRTQPDLVRGAVFGELPGKMAPLLKTGRCAAAGLFIDNDTRLPEPYRGLLFFPDAQRRVIRAYKVDQVGASFKVVEEFPFLSAEKDESFRPCKMVLGPDGAIYILGGRIYRISWSGTKDIPALPLRALDSWAKIHKLEDKELIETLSSEETSDRSRAQRELVKRGDRNRKTLIKLLNHPQTALVAQIAALAVLQSMFDTDVQAAFEKALKDGDGELQRVAAEALGLWAKKADRNAHNTLLLALATEDRSVKRAVALAMGRLAGPGAGDNLATTLSFDNSRDAELRDGILRGLELLGKSGIDALIALADSGVQKDTDRVALAFLGLRSREAFAALPTLLKHRHVSSGQRADLIRSAARYVLDPPVSLDGIVAEVARQAKETSEVKKALLEVLGMPGGAERGAKAAGLVVSLLKDDDAEVRLLAIKALRVVPSREAQAPLEKLLVNEKSSAALRREAVAVLGATAEGARLAAKLYLEKKLPKSLLPEVTEVLRKHAASDKEAKKLLMEVAK
jgi:putative membrane-bound dehydrogenase-like protein